MRVSKDFLRDFAYLANLYGWDASDIEDVKAQTRANPEPMRSYLTTLAAAHRAGYEQTQANGYQRLFDWAASEPAFCGRQAVKATFLFHKESHSATELRGNQNQGAA